MFFFESRCKMTGGRRKLTPLPHPTTTLQAALMRRRRGKLAERASSAANAALELPEPPPLEPTPPANDERLDALPSPRAQPAPYPAPAPAAAGVLVRTRCSSDDSAASAPRPETVTPVLDKSRLVSAVAADANLRTAPSPSRALPGKARRRSLEATGGNGGVGEGGEEPEEKEEEPEPEEEEEDLKHSAATPASPTVPVETSRLLRFGR